MYVRPSLEPGSTHSGSAQAVVAQPEPEPTTFGVSGKLWRDSVILYDRQTLSLWSQVDGTAKAGPSAGQRLRQLPSQVTTWGDWRRRHPATRVLVKPPLETTPYAGYRAGGRFVGLPWTRGGADDRLPGKTLVLGIVDADGEGPSPGSRSAAIPLDRLAGPSLLQGWVGALAVVVLSPGDARAAQVFERRVDGRILDFELIPKPGNDATRNDIAREGPARPQGVGHELRDRQTGSTWHLETGRALSGPLAGRQLTPVPSTPVYWATWTAFRPETELWTDDGEPAG